MSWLRILSSSTFFQNFVILRRPRVANFADIIKIATISIKKTLEGHKKKLKVLETTH